MFESHAGILGPDSFAEFVLPYVRQIESRVKEDLTSRGLQPVPMVTHFSVQLIPCRGVATDFGLGGTKPKRRLIRGPKRRLMTKFVGRVNFTTGGGWVQIEIFSKRTPLPTAKRLRPNNATAGDSGQVR